MPLDRRIELSPEEMRAFGHRAVDLVVDRLAALRDEPVAATASRPEMEARLREPPPEAGVGWEAALDRAMTDVFRPMTHNAHPRFFAYVPGPGNFVSAMADAIASAINPFAGAWAMGGGVAQAELVTVDWLRGICGLPEGAGGLFVSGGSMANLTALAAARHRLLGEDFGRAVIYCSDQTHSSVERGAGVLGFRADQLRKLPTDDAFRLRLDALEDAVGEDRTAGRTSFCVVANAGTTNTGAVDPLPEIAALCRAEAMWLHVDGAYGAAAALTDEGRTALRGMGEADSVSIDAHKWLFQPFECGCVLVRDGAALTEAFRLVPEYLRDSDRATEEVNFRDRGVQLTRGFRAFKLWMTVQVFGLGALREAVAWGMGLARTAEDELRASDAWRVDTPAQLGIVTFRFRADDRDDGAADGLQRRITAALAADGYAMLSTTELRGRTVLRLCTINPRTTEDEVRGTVRRLERIGRELAAAG
jgi:aromatic-L-amino-acid decarboxylase